MVRWVDGPLVVLDDVAVQVVPVVCVYPVVLVAAVAVCPVALAVDLQAVVVLVAGWPVDCLVDGQVVDLLVLVAAVWPENLAVGLA